MVDGVELHLVKNLECVGKSFGHVGEHFVHLLARLKPFLLRIEHAVGVVEVLSGGKAEQVVVGFGVVLIDKVAVVGADQLDAVFLSQLHQHLVGLLLQREGLAVGALMRVAHLVALKLQIVVVAEQILIPFNGFPCSCDVVLQNLRRHFACYTCRADDKVLMILLQVLAVSTRTHVIAVHPCARHQLDEVLVSVVVLGEDDEVIASHVAFLLHTVRLLAVCHVHLASEDGLERLLALLLQLTVHLVAVVEQLFHAEHIAMIGYRHTAHAVGNGLVDELLNGRLAVEERVVRVDVQMYEVFHVWCVILYKLEIKVSPYC